MSHKSTKPTNYHTKVKNTTEIFSFVVLLSPLITTETKCTDEMVFLFSDCRVTGKIISCVWLGVAALLMTLINKCAESVKRDSTLDLMINMQRTWFSIISI